MKDNQKQIDCLKELRKLAGYNQREMSVKLGIPLRTWEDWESGRILTLVSYIIWTIAD